MKIKKRYIVLAVIVGVIAGGVYYIVHNLETIVKDAVTKYGSPITGTEVKLGGFHISPFNGDIKLSNLTIGNPKEYAQPYVISVKEVTAKVDVKSITKPIIVINRISVSEPQVTYELRNVSYNNISDLLKNIMGGSKPKAEETKKDSGKKVVVDLVNVNDGKVNIAASIAGKGAGAGIPLPDIKITDIGREKNKAQGTSLAETISIIIKKILSASYQAVVEKGLAGVKDAAVDGVKAVGEGAEGIAESTKGFFKKIF